MPHEQESELLSAYLDDQLSGAERANLERRLQQVPALRTELGELQATVAALRALEPVRPPRSFTLDPAQTRRPRTGWSLPWLLQFGSGLAGLLLVLVATVQIFNSPAQFNMASMEPIPTALAPAMAPAPMMAPAADAPDASMAAVTEGALAERVPEATQAASSEVAGGLAAPPPAQDAAPDTAEAPLPAPVPAEPTLPAVAAAPPPEAAPPPMAIPSLPPGLIMACGLLLLGFGLGGYLLRRRGRGW